MTENDTTTEPTVAEATAEQVFNVSSLSDTDAEKIAEAVERVRPLKEAQRSNLLDILREDTQTLSRKVQIAFDQARRDKQAELAAQYTETEDRTQEFIDEAEKLLKAQRKQFRKLKKRAKKAGVHMDDPFHRLFRPGDCDENYFTLNVWQDRDTAEVYRRQQEVRAALEPIYNAEKAALEAINAAHHEANRTVRVASVTGDASKILHSLPSAEDLIGKIDEAIEAAKVTLERDRVLVAPQRRMARKGR